MPKVILENRQFLPPRSLCSRRNKEVQMPQVPLFLELSLEPETSRLPHSLPWEIILCPSSPNPAEVENGRQKVSWRDTWDSRERKICGEAIPSLPKVSKTLSARRQIQSRQSQKEAAFPGQRRREENGWVVGKDRASSSPTLFTITGGWYCGDPPSFGWYGPRDLGRNWDQSARSPGSTKMARFGGKYSEAGLEVLQKEQDRDEEGISSAPQGPKGKREIHRKVWNCLNHVEWNYGFDIEREKKECQKKSRLSEAIRRDEQQKES